MPTTVRAGPDEARSPELHQSLAHGQCPRCLGPRLLPPKCIGWEREWKQKAETQTDAVVENGRVANSSLTHALLHWLPVLFSLNDGPVYLGKCILPQGPLPLVQKSLRRDALAFLAFLNSDTCSNSLL